VRCGVIYRAPLFTRGPSHHRFSNTRSLLQLIGGVFKSVQVDEIDDEEGEVVRCVETWVFFALFQPLISLVFFVHGFAKLNLAIEREIDQDIVEMNTRLTYSESHVPNRLLQQMICLERLDGRALSLLFDGYRRWR